MKPFIPSPRAGAFGALAQTTLPRSIGITAPPLRRRGSTGIVLHPPRAATPPRWFQRGAKRLVSSTERCLKRVCDATGITDAICRVRHQQHHRLYQVEFGGGYVCHCEACGRSSYVQR